MKRSSGDGDLGTEVDILNGIQKLNAFVHGALEGLPAGDETGASCALVDDGGGHSFFEVVCSRGAARVDEAGAAHVAVGHLIAAEVDRMIAGEVVVNALV